MEKSINDFKPGEVYRHKDFGQVKILGREEGTVTKLKVTPIDRGDGWDPKTGTFKGVRKTRQNDRGEVVTNWSRSENREFGSEDVVHKKDLS